jgi:hypothetical protein
MKRLGWFIAGAATATGAAISREAIARRRAPRRTLAAPAREAAWESWSREGERQRAAAAREHVGVGAFGPAAGAPDVVAAPHTDLAAEQLRERIAATRARVRARRDAQHDATE